MSRTLLLVKRNVKLFFKDKGLFFTALITPAILLILYATFLGNVYRDAFYQIFPTLLLYLKSLSTDSLALSLFPQFLQYPA